MWGCGPLAAADRAADGHGGEGELAGGGHCKEQAWATVLTTPTGTRR